MGKCIFSINKIKVGNIMLMLDKVKCKIKNIKL